MRKCKNDTCTALTATTYCSRRCQLATRNQGHKGQLPDIWVSMDTERLLKQRAGTLGITVRDLVVNLIEQEFDWSETLDFGDPAA